MDLKTTTFTIAYDNDDQNSPLSMHEMDIEDLAQSLQGLGAALVSANKVLNDDQEIKVRVKAPFKASSFGIPIEVIQYATSVDVLATVGLTVQGANFALGGALEALKRLKGRKIQSLERSEDGKSKIHVDGETLEYSERVCNLVTSPSFRSAVNKAFAAPAEEGKVSKIKIKVGDQDSFVEITQEQASDLQPADDVYEKAVETDIYDTKIKFISAHAKKEGGWVIELFGKQRSADLLDEAFLNRLNSPYGNLSFGRSYKATIKETKTGRVGGRAMKTFSIIRVLEVPDNEGAVSDGQEELVLEGMGDETT